MRFQQTIHRSAIVLACLSAIWVMQAAGAQTAPAQTASSAGSCAQEATDLQASMTNTINNATRVATAPLVANPPLPAQQQACLNYNFSNFNFGLGLGSLFSGLLSNIENQACAAMSGAVNGVANSGIGMVNGQAMQIMSMPSNMINQVTGAASGVVGSATGAVSGAMYQTAAPGINAVSQTTGQSYSQSSGFFGNLSSRVSNLFN